jgi:hypothetical protein
LIIVDIVAERAFWICTQRYTQEVIEKENPDWRNQQTITIRIPLTNALEHLDKLEGSARRDIEYVFLLQFGVPHWKVAAQVQGIFENPQAIEETLAGYRQQQTEMEFHTAQLYIESGERERGAERLLDVLEESAKKEDSSDFFKASIMLAYNSDYIEKEDNRLAVAILDSALQRSDRCSDPSFVFLARGFKAHLEFLFRFRSALDLDLLAKVAEPHGRGTDAAVRLLQIEEQQAYFEAIQELERVISEALENNEFSVVCQLMVHLADTNLYAYPFIRVRLGKDEAESLLEAAAQDLDMAFQLAQALGEPELVCYVLQSQANLLHIQDDPTYEDVLNEMGRIAAESGLKAFEKAVLNLKAGLKERPPIPEEPVESDLERELTDEEELEIIHDLIKRAGINLEDKDDEISRIVRIGLRDRNPERVLRFCRHLHVAIGSYGIPGEMLGLPTAGSKFLFCDFVNACLYGQELDRLLESMQRDHCDQCEFREPRPSDWKWSREWQREYDKNRPAKFQKCIDLL